MAEFSKLRYSTADGVATIALDDPETRNALSDELLGELLAALREAKEDDEVRVVVLASTHEKVFSAGGNLGGFAADAPTAHKWSGTGLFPRSSGSWVSSANPRSSRRAATCWRARSGLRWPAT